MLEETKNFYKKTKLRTNIEELDNSKVPVTFVKVFHKNYPRFESIKLPRAQKGNLDKLFDLRESRRLFSKKPLSLKNLSLILSSCRIIDFGREPERRTYPSGGGRFPVEIYILSYNVENLNEGAYHYNFKNNLLEVLLKQKFEDKRKLTSPYLENVAASIFLTSVMSRAEVKYGLRAYPYSYLEAGHIGQNIQLKCTEFGIGSCPVSGFIDDEVIKILDLTDGEIPIYSVSVGNINERNKD